MKNTGIGALYIFFAAMAYACMGALVKVGGGQLSDTQMVFMRNFICLLILLPIFLVSERKTIKTPLLFVHIVRASAGLLNMYCFFFSIRTILLADAMLLNNTMPLFIPFIMWIWKKKKIPFLLVPGLAIGFLGVALILHPGKGILQLGALLALASGFFMSISMAGIKELSRTEPIYRILFYYFAISTIVSAIPLIWTWKSPTLFTWALLIGIGIFAWIYQLLLTKGYQKASASIISPVIYFGVVVAGAFDWIFWGQKPDLLSYIGLVFVCVGAIVCIKIGGMKA